MAQTVLKNLEAMALGDLVGDVGREGYWLRCWLALSIAAAVSMRRETAAGKLRRETSRREKRRESGCVYAKRALAIRSELMRAADAPNRVLPPAPAYLLGSNLRQRPF
jgi:hypothetical protein